MENASSFQYLLPSTLAAGGISFLLLLIQTASRRRAGWISTVAIPALLAGYSAFAVLPKSLPDIPPVTALLSLAVALASGLLFDRSSSLESSDNQMQGKRSPWPLTIWGLGTFLFTMAPAGFLKETQQMFAERASGAVSLVGVGALSGQILNWIRRLIRMKSASKTESQAVSKKVSTIAGGIAALVALLLGLLFTPESSSTATGKKAPSNSLVIGTGGALDNAPFYILDLKNSKSRSIDLTGALPRWSPDGSRIAMTRKDGNLMQLYAAEADGSSPKRLTTVSGDVIDCTWSADSQKIYFVHGPSFMQSALSVVPATGGTTEEVLPITQAVSLPAISPDGRTLAYLRGIDFSAGVSPPPQEIKLFDLNTRQSSVLITQPANDWIVTALTWTPDGKALIIGVGSNISGKPYRFERVTIADRKTSPVGDAFHAYPRSFTWTADGSTLAVVLNPSIEGKLGPGEIWLVDPTNGKRRQLETGSLNPTSIHASAVK